MKKLHSLIKFLEDDVERFKIKDKNKHLVFLGDFVDRGSYGIEVIYMITQLALHNPDQVIICRGNHEDIYQVSLMHRTKTWKNWSFATELFSKYQIDDATKLLDSLTAFYNLLPDAYLIGCKNSKHTYDYVLCCHGSIEPRHRLNTLVDDERSEVYEYVQKLVGTKELETEKEKEKTTKFNELRNVVDLLNQNKDEEEIMKNKKTKEALLKIVDQIDEDLDINEDYKKLYLEGNKELTVKLLDPQTNLMSKDVLSTLNNLQCLAGKILNNPNLSEQSNWRNELVNKNEAMRNLIKTEWTNKLLQKQKISKIYEDLNNGLKEGLKDINTEDNFRLKEYYKFLTKNVSTLTNYNDELCLRWNDVEQKDINANQFGYLWGMFDEKSNESIVSFDKDHQRMCYGKKLTDLTFKPTKKGNQIRAMFKGHQHNHDTLKDLHDCDGIFKFWTKKDKQWNKNKSSLELKEKDVVLYDAPVSFFGNDDEKTMGRRASHNARNWGTYAELSFADEFENWKLKPIKKDIF